LKINDLTSKGVRKLQQSYNIFLDRENERERERLKNPFFIC